MTVNDYPFVIVGVLRKSFRFVLPQQTMPGDEVRDIDAYVPIPTAMMTSSPGGCQEWDELRKQVGPGPFSVDVLGRLRHSAIESFASTLRTDTFTTYLLAGECHSFRKSLRVVPNELFLSCRLQSSSYCLSGSRTSPISCSRGLQLERKRLPYVLP